MTPSLASSCTVGCWVNGLVRKVSLSDEELWCYRLFDGERILRPGAAALVLEGLVNELSIGFVQKS